ncbi:hypothetical protein [Methanococcoides methylutens]|uniref:TOTE conflict system archaeo-eukaryotic primase domain-containing protein n=1 Tax=Methanococcoides methylutens TaxID=2226 RepID=UPI0012E09558|nr:hypothetical protein [Methanococcoides methylutens]
MLEKQKSNRVESGISYLYNPPEPLPLEVAYEIKPKQLPIKTSPPKTGDIRTITAYEIYWNHPNGPLILHKTTRCGCTTSLLLTLIELGETFVLIAPTTNILTQTAGADLAEFCSRKPNIIHVEPNRKCIINQERIAKYPALKKLPFLRLPKNCLECEYHAECPVTTLIRHDVLGNTSSGGTYLEKVKEVYLKGVRDQKLDGITLTTQKLVAVLLSSFTNDYQYRLPRWILDLISSSKNIIIDESHMLQDKPQVDFRIATIDEKKVSDFDFGVYDALKNMKKYKFIWEIVEHFKSLLEQNDLIEAKNKAIEKASKDNYFEEHLSHPIPNRHQVTPRYIVKAFQKIEEMVIDPEIDLQMEYILPLYDILKIITSETISVNAQPIGQWILVNVSSVDTLFDELLAIFIKNIHKSEKKRIIFTSATQGSYDFSKLLLDHKDNLKKITFGEGGDPKKTNEKMFIFPDKKKYSTRGPYAIEKHMDEITSEIIQYLELYGDGNCLIIVNNAGQAKEIEKVLEKANHPHKVEYYGSSELMGVSCYARVAIVVGLAHKPANAYDTVTDSHEESQKLRYEVTCNDTWQAWSRVKDPEGKVSSLVICLGVTSDDCENVIKYGYNRSIEIEKPPKKGMKKVKKVNVEEECITKPNIIYVRKPVEKLLAALHYKKPLYSFIPKVPGIRAIKDITGTFHQNEYKEYSRSSLIRNHIIKNKSRFMFDEDEISGTKLSDDILQKHFEGEKLVEAITLSNINEVDWICFEFAEELHMSLMHGYFEAMQFPSLVEKTVSGYRIWIFIESMKATVVKNICDALMGLFKSELKRKDIVVKGKNRNCTYFPSKTKITSHYPGDLVILPFGKDSKILIDGEFVNDFEELTIGVVSFETSSTSSSG